jgi:hypothetical protein
LGFCGISRVRAERTGDAAGDGLKAITPNCANP